MLISGFVYFDTGCLSPIGFYKLEDKSLYKESETGERFFYEWPSFFHCAVTDFAISDSMPGAKVGSMATAVSLSLHTTQITSNFHATCFDQVTSVSNLLVIMNLLLGCAFFGDVLHD